MPDISGLAVGTTTSATEEIAKLAPDAHVVEGEITYQRTGELAGAWFWSTAEAVSCVAKN